ncbi:unnamed protein product, partial [Nesidiocoris tenuis]
MSPRAQRSQVEMRFLALATRSPVFRQCRKTFGVSETFECRFRNYFAYCARWKAKNVLQTT